MKLRFFLLILIIVFMTNAHAQNKDFNIYTDLLGLSLGVGNLGFDFKIGGNSTLGLVGQSYNVRYNTLTISSGAYGARYNYYFSNAIASSFRFSLGASYAPFRISDGTYSGEYNYVFGTALLGYHWVPGTINLAFGLGAAYYSGQSSVVLRNTSGSTQTFTIPFAGVLPTFELTIGLAF